MAKRRHVAGKGSISEFRSALSKIAASLEPLTEEVAEQVAESIAKEATDRSNDQYAGSNPFGLEVRRVANSKLGKGSGIYADWYWYFGEFGTSHQPARPYLVPALVEEYSKVYPKAKAVFATLPSIRRG